jgi:hypothetical protein
LEFPQQHKDAGSTTTTHGSGVGGENVTLKIQTLERGKKRCEKMSNRGRHRLRPLAWKGGRREEVIAHWYIIASDIVRELHMAPQLNFT